MTSFRNLIIACFAGLLSQASAEESRSWTQASTGKVISGTLQSKSADNSEVKVSMESSQSVVTLKTKDLSVADQTYITKWTKPSKGIVLTPPSILQQSKGGFGSIINELGVLFAPFEQPKDDQAAHPDAVIYSGKPTDSALGGDCKITYLMPRAEVEAKLLTNRGAVIKLKVVGPAFPPGLNIYNYDINFDGYNHMSIVTDGADQVVTLQFISGNAARGFPLNFFRLDLGPEVQASSVAGSKCNYLDLKDGGGGIARSRKGEAIPVVVHLGGGSQSVTWFVPKPLVRQILFNVQEKQKTGRK